MSSIKNNSNKKEINISRDFKGVWIPREIWLMATISMEAKCLWSEIHSLYEREKGGCYASNEYLSKFMGCKPSKLSELLKELKDAKLLVTISNNGRTIVRCAIEPEKHKQKYFEEKKQVPAPAGITLPHIVGTSSIYMSNKDKQQQQLSFEEIPQLTENEIKTLKKKYSSEDIKSACRFTKSMMSKGEVDSPVAYFKKCLAEKWWLERDPEKTPVSKEDIKKRKADATEVMNFNQHSEIKAVFKDHIEFINDFKLYYNNSDYDNEFLKQKNEIDLNYLK